MLHSQWHTHSLCNLCTWRSTLLSSSHYSLTKDTVVTFSSSVHSKRFQKTKQVGSGLFRMSQVTRIIALSFHSTLTTSAGDTASWNSLWTRQLGTRDILRSSVTLVPFAEEIYSLCIDSIIKMFALTVTTICALLCVVRERTLLCCSTSVPLSNEFGN